MAADQRPAISAHRGGAGTGKADTYEAYLAALAAGADYLEFDVRAAGDGTLVAFHQARLGPTLRVSGLSYAGLCALAGYEVPRLTEVLRLLAGRARAHADLKDPACAEAAVRLATGVLDPASVLATTRDRQVARLLGERWPAAQVGLTVGGDLAETTAFALRRAGRRTISRLDDVSAVGARWAVLHYRVARPSLLAAARVRGLHVVIWTVNGDSALARWLACPAADVIVTDEPARAVALRGQAR